MARSLESYSEEVVREFYASYLATFRGSFDMAETCQTRPTHKGFSLRLRVDVSPTSIRRFLYGVPFGAARDPLTLEFDYMCNLVNSGQFQRNRDQREST